MEIRAKYGYKKFASLINRLKTADFLESVLKNIQATAIKLEKGHNENGILVELIEGGQIKGRVYADPEQFKANDISYLFFEYFGTGEYAEMQHVGTTKHFIESGYTEWFIPVDKAPALKYPVITINNMDFYLAHGVKANHFLTDAEFQTREENKQIIVEKLNTMFREVCK